jgi:hypothetical protein
MKKKILEGLLGRKKLSVRFRKVPGPFHPAINTSQTTSDCISRGNSTVNPHLVKCSILAR